MSRMIATWRRQRGPRRLGGGLLSALLGCLLGDCASVGHFEHGIFRRGELVYRVGRLPAPWTQISDRDVDLVFHHPQGGTIVANAQCQSSGDVSLEVLTNHLLFGIEREVEQPPVTMTLDGRGALRSRVRGALDGVTVDLELVVLKKDRCTYDLQLVAGPAEFPRRLPDFETFLGAFTTQPGG